MFTKHLKQPEDRRKEAQKRRVDAVDFYEDQAVTKQNPNGDTELFQVYSKGLKHDSLGVVEQSSFDSLLTALDTGSQAKFEAIQVGFSGFDPKKLQKLTDPQCGLAFDTEGPDCTQYALPMPPTFLSRETMGEIAENYWMALLRDVPFSDYAANAVAQKAAAHLTTFGTDFKGPKVGNAVTTATLFRGDLPGADAGPYLSQFMLWDIPYGAQKTPAQVAFGFPPNQDYMVDPADYLKAQEGFVADKPGHITPVYMRGGREVSHYVHIDELFQGYLNACLLLITPVARGGFGAAIASGNPYSSSKTQTGFGTLGEPNFKVVLAEVSSRALKAVWYQKWFVHRRQRPEVFAARIHFQKTNQAAYGLDLSEMDELLELVRVHNETFYSGGDSYLLPMAYPEGSPTHPAYGAGHATVAGACVTLLKALFKDMKFSDLMVTPIERDASGNAVKHPEYDLRIHGELNKLAASVGMARNIAGVHWRSDFAESLKLGECIALNFLREAAFTYNEDVSFTFPLFSGKIVSIQKNNPKNWKASDFPCNDLMKS
ncbi:MAG: vanadium-dependent haloperoxidase [Acidobacteriota bacterium]|nr:vanadium-dependent haloperoxidase [Acidobacteriota bacterium]